jgi:hypothetical protein
MQPNQGVTFDVLKNEEGESTNNDITSPKHIIVPEVVRE